MSTNPTPTQTVQIMYAAFGRGDIAGVLSHLRSDVDWRLNVDPKAPGAAAIPLMRARRGPAQVGEFFAELGQSVEFHGFEPQSFMAGDREVAARVKMDATIRPTGARLTVESMHHFTFDESGKVSRFVEFFDTLAEAAAWGKIQEKR